MSDRLCNVYSFGLYFNFDITTTTSYIPFQMEASIAISVVVRIIMMSLKPRFSNCFHVNITRGSICCQQLNSIIFCQVSQF